MSDAIVNVYFSFVLSYRRNPRQGYCPKEQSFTWKVYPFFDIFFSIFEFVAFIGYLFMSIFLTGMFEFNSV